MWLEMPELPEVETVMRGLSPHLLNQRITSVELRRAGLRYPFPSDMVEKLEGRKIEDLSRRAKYLLIHLQDDLTWLCHLGMSGRFTIYEDGINNSENGKHDHVMFSLESGCDVVYTDHRRFGIMDLLKTSELHEHKLLAHLGPEPLIEEFTGKVLYDAFQTKKSPVKTALLDQRIVAGLGNIYVCEALNTVGISPRRKACNISKGKCTFLVEAIKNILLSSIAVGGSTLQDFAGVDGDLGYFPASFRVYGREGEECQSQDCDGNIKRISQAGRSTFFCSSCQY